MFYNEADTFWRPTVAPNVWAPVVSYAASSQLWRWRHLDIVADGHTLFISEGNLLTSMTKPL